MTLTIDMKVTLLLLAVRRGEEGTSCIKYHTYLCHLTFDTRLPQSIKVLGGFVLFHNWQFQSSICNPALPLFCYPSPGLWRLNERSENSQIKSALWGLYD
jgi:hypothetical protein